MFCDIGGQKGENHISWILIDYKFCYYCSNLFINNQCNMFLGCYTIFIVDDDFFIQSFPLKLNQQG